MCDWIRKGDFGGQHFAEADKAAAEGRPLTTPRFSLNCRRCMCWWGGPPDSRAVVSLAGYDGGAERWGAGRADAMASSTWERLTTFLDRRGVAVGAMAMFCNPLDSCELQVVQCPAVPKHPSRICKATCQILINYSKKSSLFSFLCICYTDHSAGISFPLTIQHAYERNGAAVTCSQITRGASKSGGGPLNLTIRVEEEGKEA